MSFNSGGRKVTGERPTGFTLQHRLCPSLRDFPGVARVGDDLFRRRGGQRLEHRDQQRDALANDRESERVHVFARRFEWLEDSGATKLLKHWRM